MEDNQEKETIVEETVEEKIEEKPEEIIEEKVEEKKEEKQKEAKKEKKKANIGLPILYLFIILFAILATLLVLYTIKNHKTNPTLAVDNKIYVTFNTNGGEQIERIVLDKEQEISLPTPTKNGYTFLGWYQGGQKVDEKFKVTTSTTLLAKWERKDSKKEYTITFSPYANPKSITLQCGSPLFIKDIEEPEKDYNYFWGWTNKATGRQYVYGEILPCEDTVFEALWSQRTAYISYYAWDNGKYNRFNDLSTDIDCSDNMFLKLPEKAPELEGRKFVKWIYDYPDAKKGQEAHDGDRISCDSVTLQGIYEYIIEEKKETESTPEDESEEPTNNEEQPEEPENEENNQEDENN